MNKKKIIIVKRNTCSTFEIKSVKENISPLDVIGIKLNLKADDIVDYIKDSRSSRFNSNKNLMYF